MKTVLLIIALLIPTAALAGGYHVRSSCGNYAGSYGHGYSYRGNHVSPGHYVGYRYYSPYRYSTPYRHHYYRGSAFTSQGFDYSAYPTGGGYRPDPPGFQYQSITPGGTVEGVHTWTDAAGTIHFSDTPAKKSR